MQLAVQQTKFVENTDSAEAYSVPEELEKGTLLSKVNSHKKPKQVVVRIDADQGQILWQSKKYGIINAEAIREVRSGKDASYDLAQLGLPQTDLSRFISVIYVLNGEYRTLNLIAPTVELFNLWDAAIRHLHTIRQGLMSGLGNMEVREAIWEKMYWKGADEEGDQKLDFDDVERLCVRLSVNASKDALKKLFDEVDTNRRGSLDFASFQLFVKQLKRRPELDGLFGKICDASPTKRFDFAAFEKFMKEQQQSSLSQESMRSIFDKHATKEAEAQEALLSSAGFTSFLLSPDNAAYPCSNEGTQDMSHPLSHYYISSSHNTYLVGHQLVGVSTIEGYVRALLSGCRSVELDIYDGDDGGEPICTHGNTLTKDIPLRAICTAINKYAFVTSPYPLIISAEVHCGIEGQDQIVKVMKECFGNRLISDEDIIATGEVAMKKIDKLPSVESLKEKFLLKAKNLYIIEKLAAIAAPASLEPVARASTAPAGTSIEVEAPSSSESSEEETETDSSKTAKAKAELKSLKDIFKTKVLRSKSPIPSAGSRSASKASAREKPKPKMSLSLASLLVYTVGVKCRGLSTGPDGPQYEPEHIFSLSENTASKMIKENMLALIQHCENHLVRVYPKGLRVNSSNYEPHAYWAAGAQVVAINWQTFDFGYMINQAMFQQFNRAGYVLKPLTLRMHGSELLQKRTKHFLDVTVISAQQLPLPKNGGGLEIVHVKSIIDPLVEVSLHIPDWSTTPFLPTSASKAKYSPATKATTTKPTSARKVAFRTPVVQDNGFNPVWQEEMCLPFDLVGGREGGMMDLVFVKFTVWQKGKDDGDDEPLAVFCAPLGRLGQGFRHLPLHDSQCVQHMFSTLFVQIGIRDTQ
ncbi:hypothetical protein HGRIS_012126 [Hohenbuehelia grisea]|uniref:Phosphoinositide phospholipase C n=1 Tax=Hohenbuehelia grisea TaxID=104357 RepID=A0ABR3IRC2_9AGAR